MTPPPEKGTYYAHPLPPLSLDCSVGTSKIRLKFGMVQYTRFCTVL